MISEDLVTYIDGISRNTIRPDYATTVAEHKAVIAYWNVIDALKQSGMALTITEWEGQV